MVYVTDIKEYDDFADLTVDIEDEVELFVTIEDGEWVTDEPDADWVAERKDFGFYEIGSDVEETLDAIDYEELYEDACEDLINTPEIRRLNDGVYKITADVLIKKQLSGFLITPEEAGEWDGEQGYLEHYHVYSKPTYGIDETTLSVSVDNIKIEEV